MRIIAWIISSYASWSYGKKLGMRTGVGFYAIMTIVSAWIAWPVALILFVLFIMWAITSLVLGLTDGRYDNWLTIQEGINNAKEKGGK